MVIEVYYEFEDETNCEDGTLIAEFYDWSCARLFVNAYEMVHGDEMQEQGYVVKATEKWT